MQVGMIVVEGEEVSWMRRIGNGCIWEWGLWI